VEIVVTLTSWLDGLMAEPSRRTGIPREQLSAHVGGELIGSILEIVSGLFSRGWLHVAVNAAAGAIALGYATYATGVPERLRREMLSLGAHLAFRALELVRMGGFWRSIRITAEAIKTGDINAILSSVLKTPSEVSAEVFGGGAEYAPEVMVAPPETYELTPPPQSPEYVQTPEQVQEQVAVY
jgi:hypothetical protein